MNDSDISKTISKTIVEEKPNMDMLPFPPVEEFMTVSTEVGIDIYFSREEDNTWKVAIEDRSKGINLRYLYEKLNAAYVTYAEYIWRYHGQ